MAQVKTSARRGGVAGHRYQRVRGDTEHGEATLFRAFATTRSSALRDQLIERFMPLARSLALRYRRGGEPLDDLIQVANLALVKAVDGFDLARGTPFATYAVPTILGEIRRHFRDRVWMLRLPRGLSELTMKVDRAIDTLAKELGRTPTTPEVAERIDASVEDVLEALEAGHARRTGSLDAPATRDEESTTMIDTVGSIDSGYDRVEAGVAAAGAGLDEREWRVMRMRFVDEMTQTDIGKVLGVSQMQVSRISRKALGKLLAAVGGPDAERDAAPG